MDFLFSHFEDKEAYIEAFKKDLVEIINFENLTEVVLMSAYYALTSYALGKIIDKYIPAYNPNIKFVRLCIELALQFTINILVGYFIRQSGTLLNLLFTSDEVIFANQVGVSIVQAFALFTPQNNFKRKISHFGGILTKYGM